MFMPTKNVYVSEADLPLFDRAAELAGGMSPAIAAGLRLYVAQQEKKRKDTEMQTIELAVDEGNIVTTKRFTGRQVLRSQIKDGRRVQTYRAYLTAKGQYAVYTRDDPNWSALTRTGDDAPVDAETWEGEWWHTGQRTLQVFPDLASMRGIVPDDVTEALASIGDQPTVEDLDI